MTRAEQNGNDLILALDWCSRHQISGQVVSFALFDGRPEFISLLCRRLMRALQDHREIESKARRADKGRGGAAVSETQSVTLFLAARMVQRCSERRTGVTKRSKRGGSGPGRRRRASVQAVPAELWELLDACRGEAIPTPKTVKPPSQWSRAVYYAAEKRDASLAEIATAAGVTKMTIFNWKRLPEFQAAVEKAQKDMPRRVKRRA